MSAASVCYLPILFLYFCTQLQTVLALCPAPFSLEAGKCVFVNTAQNYSWCEANRQCASIGGELINSYDSLQLLNSMPSLNCSGCRIWFGVSDMADERGLSRSGWQLINDNGFLPLNDSLWFSGMPNSNGNQDCVSRSPDQNTFLDFQCSHTRGFACEFIEAAAVPNPSVASTSYWKQIPFKRTSYNPSTDYCFTDLMEVENAMHCIAAAMRAGSTRYVLFNSKLMTCRLLHFSDAQVEQAIETSADWVKFGMQ